MGRKRASYDRCAYAFHRYVRGMSGSASMQRIITQNSSGFWVGKVELVDGKFEQTHVVSQDAYDDST
jgi:hypothetical protein